MSVFDFTDYRRFLTHMIAQMRGKGRGQIHKIAQFCGVHPSLISQVLNNQKNVSMEQAQLICEYLGLTSQETEYFFCSVQLQRAGTHKLQEYYKKKLTLLQEASIELSERIRQDKALTEEEKSIFYSHWLYAAIWLQTSFSNGQSLDEITDRFQIPRERATEILHFLVKTKLCFSQDGKFLMGPQSIHLARGSVHLPKHHSNWRLRAIDASDRITPDEMMYTAPISISKSDFKKIRARLADVVKEVTEIAIQSEAEELACFNLDFFLIKK